LPNTSYVTSVRIADVALDAADIEEERQMREKAMDDKVVPDDRFPTVEEWWGILPGEEGCRACRGRGWVLVRELNDAGRLVVTGREVCVQCDGTGEVQTPAIDRLSFDEYSGSEQQP